MLLTAGFLILALITGILLLVLVIMAIVLFLMRVLRKDEVRPTKRFRRFGIVVLVLVLCCAAMVVVSQLTASTPPVVDENGNTPDTAIAELIKVNLGGRQEWISIRGWDAENPVLLFLAGGPGGSQMAATRYELAELEKHFVVVNWDQPGAGKSYAAVKGDALTVDMYVEDGIALTKYLQERFAQEKIYLIGESWGSALGILMADRYPEGYYGLIGTGQMVDFAQTERINYATAMQIAQEQDDSAIVQQLTANGEPPYYGDDMIWKSAVYLNYLSNAMAANDAVENPGYNTFRDLFSQEYGLVDQLHYVQGVVTTFNHVYQQLYETDLRTDYASLVIPVHFFLGRHDINAPTALVEAYVEMLDAPAKEIVWFEASAHSPWINQRDLFVQEVLRAFAEDTE